MPTISVSIPVDLPVSIYSDLTEKNNTCCILIHQLFNLNQKWCVRWTLIDTAPCPLAACLKVGKEINISYCDASCASADKKV